MADEFDADKLRRDAIRRMREMQRRAMPLSDENIPSEAPKAASQGSPLRDVLSSLVGNGSRPPHELFKLAGIPIDEEKALIGMLIYILYKQGADVKLLLALGYLLL